MSDVFEATNYAVETAYGQVSDWRARIFRSARSLRAAERLAHYRLRKFCRENGKRIVTVVEFKHHDDFMRDAYHVAAVARVTDAPVPGGWMLPPTWSNRGIITLPTTAGSRSSADPSG